MLESGLIFLQNSFCLLGSGNEAYTCIIEAFCFGNLKNEQKRFTNLHHFCGYISLNSKPKLLILTPSFLSLEPSRMLKTVIK